MGSRKIIILIAMAVMVSLLLGVCSSSSTPTGLIKTPKPSVRCERTKSQRLAVRWIEVSLDEQKVLLSDDEQMVGEYLVSAGVGTSPETEILAG